MSRRRYAVMGLGQFGSALALELTRLGIDVLAIDMDPKKVDALKEEVAAVAIADIRDRHALVELFTTPFDAAIVAIGDHLEAEILSTLFLKELKVPVIVAEANSDERAEVLQRVGATMTVSPELEFGRRFARRLANPNLLEFVPLAQGYGASEMVAPAWAEGKTLAELELRKKTSLAVITMVGLDGKTTVMPGGSARVEKGTILTVIGRIEDLDHLRSRV